MRARLCAGQVTMNEKQECFAKFAVEKQAKKSKSHTTDSAGNAGTTK